MTSPAEAAGADPPIADAGGTGGPTTRASAVRLRARSGRRRGVLAALDRPLITAFVATLGLLGALVLGWALGSISTILGYIVLALFLALGLDPIVRMLERHRIKRGAGIAIVFVAFCLLAAAFLIFVVPPVVTQIAEFVGHLPVAAENMKTTDWFLALDPQLQFAIVSALDQIKATIAAPETLAVIGGGVLAVGVGLATAITGIFIVVALTLYFLSSLTSMKQAFYSLAPARNRPHLSQLTERITASVGSALIGSVILSAFNSATVFVLHLLLNLPFPALMAVVAFVITLVPLFGSVIFLVLGTAIALFSSPQQALIFAIAYLVYIQLESYVISPRVMNRAISIPAALVLIGALVGGTLMGILGVLLALPVMASLLLIVHEVIVPKQDLEV